MKVRPRKKLSSKRMLQNLDHPRIFFSFFGSQTSFDENRFFRNKEGIFQVKKTFFFEMMQRERQQDDSKSKSSSSVILSVGSNNDTLLDLGSSILDFDHHRKICNSRPNDETEVLQKSELE